MLSPVLGGFCCMLCAVRCKKKIGCPCLVFIFIVKTKHMNQKKKNAQYTSINKKTQPFYSNRALAAVVHFPCRASATIGSNNQARPIDTVKSSVNLPLPGRDESERTRSIFMMSRPWAMNNYARRYITWHGCQRYYQREDEKQKNKQQKTLISSTITIVIIIIITLTEHAVGSARYRSVRFSSVPNWNACFRCCVHQTMSVAFGFVRFLSHAFPVPVQMCTETHTDTDTYATIIISLMKSGARFGWELSCATQNAHDMARAYGALGNRWYKVYVKEGLH